MGKREDKKAAKIYALANTYHSLTGADADSDHEWVVRGLAIAYAENELAKMGLQPSDLCSIRECIAAAAA